MKISKCPFCGSEAILIETTKLRNKLYWVRCKAECCEQIGFEEENSAISKWNARYDKNNK